MVTYSSHHSLDFSCLNPWSLPCKSNVKELFSNYPQLWTHHTALHRGHTFISSFKMGSLIMLLFKSRVLLCSFSAVLDMIIVSHIYHKIWKGFFKNAHLFLCLMVKRLFRTVILLAVYSHRSHLIWFPLKISSMLISFLLLPIYYLCVRLSICITMLMFNDSNLLSLLMNLMM